MPNDMPDTLEPQDDHEILREIWCDVKEIKDDYKTLRRILFGNGELGLAGKVNLMWGIAIAIAGTVVTGLLGYLGWLVVR